MTVRKVFLCPVHCKPRPSGVCLESPELKNIFQVPWDRAEVGQNYDVRKPVLATLWVLKWGGAIFRPRSSKVSVQNVLLSPFHCKPRPSGVSLESAGLQNIPQVPWDRAEVGEINDARNAVSATLWPLKWSGAMFHPRRSKVSVQKVLLCPFYCNPSPSEVSLESPGLENIPEVPGNRARSRWNLQCVEGGLGYSMSLEVKWGYISVQKLESEH